MIRPELLREAQSYTPDERLEVIEVLLAGLLLDHLHTERLTMALRIVERLRHYKPMRLVR
ncbi:MAG: hypothetical protein JNK72_00220 [Myxococcales bacterium]|nr:hypothetical protein [Myxococcales bacterium]